MRSRQLQELLARELGRPLGEIDKRCRGLRSDGLIESGPRGLGAPDLSPEDAALHLLSMVSRRATDALDVARKAMYATRYIDDGWGSIVLDNLFGASLHDQARHSKHVMPTIGEVVARLMGGAKLPDDMFMVFEIDEKGEEASICPYRVVAGGGDTLAFGVHLFTAAQDGRPAQSRAGYKFVFRSELLVEIGRSLAKVKEVPVETVPGGGPLRLRRRREIADEQLRWVGDIDKAMRSAE